MATDWYIKFKEKVPKKGELKSIALNYMGADVASIEEQNDGFFMLNLPGEPSNPFKGLPRGRDLESQPSRWIEFSMFREGELALTTRQQDEYTNCVAVGIARCIARWYGAELKEPG